MIVILDANVLASGLVAREGGTIATIVESWRDGRFELTRSEHLYGELAGALADPYFTGRVPAPALPATSPSLPSVASSCHKPSLSRMSPHILRMI